MESIGEDSVVAIEEEDDDCGDECNGAQLRERANLMEAVCQYSSPRRKQNGPAAYNTSRHLDCRLGIKQ